MPSETPRRWTPASSKVLGVGVVGKFLVIAVGDPMDGALLRLERCAFCVGLFKICQPCYRGQALLRHGVPVARSGSSRRGPRPPSMPGCTSRCNGSRPGAPAFVLGAAGGTRLELGSVIVRVDATLRRDRPSIALTFDTRPSALVLAPGDGDGFLRRVLSREARLPLDMGLEKRSALIDSSASRVHSIAATRAGGTPDRHAPW